jgi:CBS domain-containing protein
VAEERGDDEKVTSLVRDVMTTNVISVRKHAQFKDILRVMRAHQFSAFPVLDNADRVIGVVSEDDLLVKTGYDGSEPVAGFLMRRADKVKAAALTAGELMTRRAIAIGPDASVAEAARTMHAKHVKRLPVVSHDGRLVGVVSRTDLLGVYDRPDSEIRDEIVTQVIGDQFLLDGRAFTVTVEAGVVTLRGRVESELVGLSLLDSVRHVDGVIGIRETLSYLPVERRAQRV